MKKYLVRFITTNADLYPEITYENSLKELLI